MTNHNPNFRSTVRSEVADILQEELDRFENNQIVELQQDRENTSDIL